MGYFRFMRVVCYHLRVRGNRNVVLLIKFKNAPGVVMEIGCWAKMGSISECGRLTCVESSRKLATGIS